MRPFAIGFLGFSWCWTAREPCVSSTSLSKDKFEVLARQLELSAAAPDEWAEFRRVADAKAAERAAYKAKLREFMEGGQKHLPLRSEPAFDALTHDKDVEIEMRDGVVLRADVWRPAARGRFPAIVHRGPYNKSSVVDWTPLLMRELASRGYACIAQDVRGRYASEGEVLAFANEEADGYDTVEWVSHQPWCSGCIGMLGVSYSGWASYALALSGHPALKCIVPVNSGFNRVFATVAHNVPLAAAAAWWLYAMAPSRELLNRRRIDLAHLPLSEIPLKAGLFHSEYARVLDPRSRLGEGWLPLGLELPAPLPHLAVPALVVAGWYDDLLPGTLAAWSELASAHPHAQLLIGPWHHDLTTMEEPQIGLVSTREPAIDVYYHSMEQFLSRHLLGEPGKAVDRVLIYVMGRDVWRAEPAWPLSRSKTHDLYLGATDEGEDDGGSRALSWQPLEGSRSISSFVYDPQDAASVPLDGADNVNEMGSYECSRSRTDRLAFQTAPLAAGIELTGSATLVLYAQSNAETTDFVVKVVDEYPDGHRQFVTHGMVRTAYRNDGNDAAPLDPTTVYEFRIELKAISYYFAREHVLEAEVSSVDFPRYFRNQNVFDAGTSARCVIAQQTVHHSAVYPSRLLLPLVPP